jgi:hypothetical protein
MPKVIATLFQGAPFAQHFTHGLLANLGIIPPSAKQLPQGCMLPQGCRGGQWR